MALTSTFNVAEQGLLRYIQSSDSIRRFFLVTLKLMCIQKNLYYHIMMFENLVEKIRNFIVIILFNLIYNKHLLISDIVRNDQYILASYCTLNFDL